MRIFGRTYSELQDFGREVGGGPPLSDGDGHYIFPSGHSYSGYDFVFPEPERVLSAKVRYYTRVLELVEADLDKLQKAMGLVQIDARYRVPFDWPEPGDSRFQLYGPGPRKWADGVLVTSDEGALARLRELHAWASRCIDILTEHQPQLRPQAVPQGAQASVSMDW